MDFIARSESARHSEPSNRETLLNVPSDSGTLVESTTRRTQQAAGGQPQPRLSSPGHYPTIPIRLERAHLRAFLGIPSKFDIASMPHSALAYRLARPTRRPQKVTDIVLPDIRNPQTGLLTVTAGDPSMRHIPSIVHPIANSSGCAERTPRSIRRLRTCQTTRCTANFFSISENSNQVHRR